MTIADGLVAQTHQCFANIAAVLYEAGATLGDVLRARHLLVDAKDFATVAPIFGRYFAVARPAPTAMVVGLVDPGIKIEIENTARVPKNDGPRGTRRRRLTMRTTQDTRCC